MGTPEISIIILSLNHWEKTCTALASLGETKGPSFETILVDNGSSRETLRELAGFQNGVLARRIRLQCHLNSTNKGVASGRNQGAELARSGTIVFLDNDVEIEEDRWLNYLYSGLYSDDSLAVSGGVLLNPDNGRSVQFRGGSLDERCRLLFHKANLPRNEEQLVDTDYCLGACLMVRKSVWDELRGFDTLFDPMDYEDIDFCLRVRQRGYRIAVVPRSRLIHHQHTTTGTVGFSRMRNYLINGRKFKKRWQAYISSHIAGTLSPNGR